MKKAEITFTRDFNFYCNQTANDQYMYVFPEIWGKSLECQIIAYDGRASHWIRFPTEQFDLKNFMIKKPLNTYFFEQPGHEIFREHCQKLRKLLTIPVSKIKNDYSHYQKIKYFFTNQYFYTSLCMFLPGAWREDFLNFHGKQNKKALTVLNRAMETRHKSEGLLKELGDYMRVWLGPKLAEKKYPASYVKLLSISETEEFILSGNLPKLSTLRQRSRGFVYLYGKIFPTSNWKKFLQDNNILITEQRASNSNQIAGTVACPGKIVKGKVRIVMNSEEAKNVKKGEILLTSMTAPDYVPAMLKSAAIITDEGGITSHAAIVAREMKKPCIIGTKIATKVFKDGDLVEVDANKGIVRKL